MKRRRSIFLSVLLFVCLISCNNNDPSVHSLTKTKKYTSTSRSNEIGDTKKQKLSSMLYHLAISKDPESFAKQHHIFFDRDRIRVFIFFEPSSSDPERKKILEDHGIIIEKESTDMIRGLVTIDQLIPLSEESVIRLIRLPDKLIKTRKTSL